MQRKKKTRFQKITMVAIWLMLIAMLGSLIFGAVASLNLIYPIKHPCSRNKKDRRKISPVFFIPHFFAYKLPVVLSH